MAKFCGIMAIVFKLIFTCILVHKAGAAEFRVGGSIGWTVPAEPNSTVYNQWAERNRFQIGDSLLFVYDREKDSVLWVNKEEYDQCNIRSLTATFNDGKTSFKLNHSGPYYFISGTDGNCLKNEKMLLIVMADKTHKSTLKPNNTSPSPAPSPAVSSPPENPPATAPATAPVGQESPSPPSPTPTNGASYMTMQLTTIFGFLYLSSHFLFA